MIKSPTVLQGTHSDWQLEILLQFLVGTYDQDLNYVDDWKFVLKLNLSSISGFWLDCLTSIPWSWMDMHAYLVCRASSSINLIFA